MLCFVENYNLVSMQGKSYREVLYVNNQRRTQNGNTIHINSTVLFI